MERVSVETAIKRSLFFRVMSWLTPELTTYTKIGNERMVLVCPKNDYLIED